MTDPGSTSPPARARPGRSPSGRTVGTGRWPARTKQLVVRFSLLVCACLAWGVLALVLVTDHGSSSSSISVSNGHVTRTVLPGVTAYGEDPGPVRIVLLVSAGAVVVSAASLTWRAARQSSRIGVAGMAVGGAAVVAALLGAFTIGPFLLPLAAVLIIVALPIAPSRPDRPPGMPGMPGMPAPGWYPDPTGRSAWRFWDGGRWSEHVTPASGSDTDPL